MEENTVNYKILIKSQNENWHFYAEPIMNEETGRHEMVIFNTDDLNELEEKYKELLLTNIGSNLKAIQDLGVNFNVEITDHSEDTSEE